MVAPAPGQAQGPDPDPAPAAQGPRPDPAPQAPATSAPAPVTTVPAPAPAAPVTSTPPAPVPTAAPRVTAPAPAATSRTITRTTTRTASRPAPRPVRKTARRHAARTQPVERSKPKPAAATAPPYPQRPYARESGLTASAPAAVEAAESGGGRGSADTRLILQLGMLFSLVYVVFLCVWFRATRHLRADGTESVLALMRRRARAWWERAFAGFGRPSGRRMPERREDAPAVDADAQWTCEIAYQPGQLRFQAVMEPQDPGGSLADDHKGLHWPRGVPKPSARELETAMGALFASIAAAGWEPVHPGGVWSERRFVWRKAGQPPTSFELVGAGPAGLETGATRTARQRAPRAPRGANREAVLRTVAARPGLTLRELTAATGVKPSSLPPLLRTLTLRGELEKRRLPNGQTGYALSRPAEEPAGAAEELQAAP